MSNALQIALLDYKIIDSQMMRLLEKQTNDLAQHIRVPLELTNITIRRPSKHPNAPQDLLTNDTHNLIAHDDVDLMIKMIDNIEPTHTLLTTTLANNKNVMTANKTLLAKNNATLHNAATHTKTDLYYKTTMANAIPLLRPLRKSLANDRITRILNIINGTTNFILSRMDTTKTDFDKALAETTALDYTKTNPSTDVDGYNAASKTAILTNLAFHTHITTADVHHKNIDQVNTANMASAKTINCTMKLLTICERTNNNNAKKVTIRIHPAMIPRTHPLASIDNAFNTVFVKTETTNSLIFYKHGARKAPTTSAVLNDLITVARNQVNNSQNTKKNAYTTLPIQPMNAVHTHYHIALDIADQPNVLAAVTNAFADNSVSIQTIQQKDHDDTATLILVTHTTADSALAQTVARLSDMSFVRRAASVMRVEGMAAE